MTLAVEGTGVSLPRIAGQNIHFIAVVFASPPDGSLSDDFTGSVLNFGDGGSAPINPSQGTSTGQGVVTLNFDHTYLLPGRYDETAVLQDNTTHKTAYYDSANSSFYIVVQPAQQAPTITSTNAATFTAGQTNTFTITATGTPVPTIAETGALPTGVTFTPNTATGTATLAGTPTVTTTTAFHLTITASNGVTPDATQAFTLTVNPATNPDQQVLQDLQALRQSVQTTATDQQLIGPTTTAAQRAQDLAQSNQSILNTQHALATLQHDITTDTDRSLVTMFDAVDRLFGVALSAEEGIQVHYALAHGAPNTLVGQALNNIQTAYDGAGSGSAGIDAPYDGAGSGSGALVNRALIETLATLAFDGSGSGTSGLRVDLALAGVLIVFDGAGAGTSGYDGAGSGSSGLVDAAVQRAAVAYDGAGAGTGV